MAVKSPDTYGISELCEVIDRRPGTVRKWEAEKRLPKRLLPKRGERNRRYWTRAQVKGIQKWMKDTDMRPGPLVTDPEREHEHIAALRRPKYLNGFHVQSAKKMAENGRSAAYIIKKIHPRTKYVKPETLEAVLKQVFADEGLEWPAK